MPTLRTLQCSVGLQTACCHAIALACRSAAQLRNCMDAVLRRTGRHACSAPVQCAEPWEACMTYIMQILRAGDARENSLKALCCVEVPNGKKKKNHYILSSQLRAREGFLCREGFLLSRHAASYWYPPASLCKADQRDLTRPNALHYAPDGCTVLQLNVECGMSSLGLPGDSPRDRLCFA